MKKIINTLVLLVLFSVSVFSNNNNNITIKQGMEPSWVRKFPADKLYYTGIGNGSNLVQAQNNAVNSILSQIKVKVESEITDYTTEKNGVVNEEVSTKIKVTLKDSVEDIELVDMWYSEKRGYWAYYRLNIAYYQQKLKQREKQAVDISFDFLKKADEEKDSLLSLKHSLSGFSNIGKYLLNAEKVNYKGEEKILTNELNERIQKKLSVITVNSLADSYRMKKIVTEALVISFIFKIDGKPLSNLPVKFSSKKGEAVINHDGVTDQNGVALCSISKVIGVTNSIILSAEPDLIKMADIKTDDDDLKNLYNLILSGFTKPVKDVVIDIDSPVIGFRTEYLNDISNESSLKGRLDILPTLLKNKLISLAGCTVVESGTADYRIIYTIDGNINLSGDVYFTRLLISVRVVENMSNKEIFTYSMESPIKGGGAVKDKPRSVQNAVKKITDEYSQVIEGKIVGFLIGE